MEPDRPHAPGQRSPLTPKGRAALERFAQQLDAKRHRRGPRRARPGEFIEFMPVEDVALQLVSIANSAGPITQDAGDFDRLEQLYLAFGRIVQHAYGKPRSTPRPRCRPRRPAEARGRQPRHGGVGRFRMRPDED